MECKKSERWNPGAPNDSVEYQGGAFTTENGSETGYAPAASWESYDVTGIVKKFIDGTPNYGFLLVNDYKSGNTERIYISSEYQTDKSWRPKLTIKSPSIGIVQSHAISREKAYTIIKTADFLKIYMRFKGRYTLELVDMMGRNIISYNDAGQKCHQIPIRRLCDGMYVMNIGINGIKYKGKVIIIK